MAEHIKDLIASGVTVVIDRYYYSGCVYSAAKQNPTMDLAWCRHMEVGLPRPDLCLFLDVKAEEAERRGGFGNERYEKKELQDRVRGLFGEMRIHEDECEDIVIVDAGSSVENVEKEIQTVVKERFGDERHSEGPLRFIRPW
ncbi:Thymidylate kinase [Lecanosticta acicola]|uniref:dTMP kinase n=1 Tax=Lecanosticta acicola TaxID=111012 RepID=A0AAI9E7M4_9PEZI|nr:Thymidylate kinase [Lecanosticta acicola]